MKGSIGSAFPDISKLERVSELCFVFLPFQFPIFGNRAQYSVK